MPGFVAATVSTLLLIALTILHWQRVGWTVASAYMLVFGTLCYSLTPLHFEHWFAFLGEMPAAFLCTVAGTIVAVRPEVRAGPVAAASLLFGAAVMTKHLVIGPH